MENQQLISIDQLDTDSYGIVRQIQGGRELANRLTSMGLSTGSTFKVLQNRHHGPVLVLVRNTRIALGRGEAMKILAEKLHEQQESD